MNQAKGFITIATGNEEYYQIAANLVKSYRYFTEECLPFGILCDRKNKYTELFDDVIIYPDIARGSYLDKLNMGEFIPYKETIFIDADCLAYGDLNKLFTCFKEADDFSCFGRVLPLDDKTGWFEYENLGSFQDKVSYIVGLHGGIYYMRISEKEKAVFETARELIPDYNRFHFKGKFNTPGDEPLIALSMALNNIKPTKYEDGTICCYWEHQDSMKADISVPIAKTSRKSQNYILVHWGTRFTRQLLYKEQVDILNILIQGESSYRKVKRCQLTYRYRIISERLKNYAKRIQNKITKLYRGNNIR